MSKPIVVLAEEDENVCIPLQMKLAFTLNVNTVIEIVSTKDAMERYLKQNHDIDILIIDEKLYQATLIEYNIGKVFILVEELNGIQNQNFSADIQSRSYSETRLFKYSDVNILFGMIIPTEWIAEKERVKKCNVITFMSPIGGAGCTTVALGVAGYLAQNYKNVLYLNSQSIQTFQYYLKYQNTLSRTASGLLTEEKRDFDQIKKCFIHEQFDFLPGLVSTRQNLGIKTDAYKELVITAKTWKEYDYILIDAGTEIDVGIIELIEESELVFVVTRQDEYSAYKTQKLTRFFNFGDKEKFRFICNMFDPKKKNAYMMIDENRVKAHTKIDEYILAVSKVSNINELIQIKDIQKLGITIV